MENPEGRGEFKLKNLVGGVWIFSGIIHHEFISSTKAARDHIIFG